MFPVFFRTDMFVGKTENNVHKNPNKIITLNP